MNGESYSRGADGARHGSSRDHLATRERGDRDRDDRRDRDRGDRNRRRSRSPVDYHSSRGGRRDGGEPDSYSSSRSRRDREREDRYSVRDRRDRDRGDRGDRDSWDRDRNRDRDRGDRGDRGDRDRDRDRDRRRGGRDDDDRLSHRDMHDHRPRGGGRRDRDRDFDRGGDRDRRRSTSPINKKREPTPDLTNVTSVLERKRRLTQWDIKPPGYESVSAEQAKLSGMFPLPGAPRQQAIDPAKLQAFIAQPPPTQGGGAVSVLKPTNSREAKRLLISNLPSSVTEEELQSFFNLQLNGLNVIDGSDPCVQCQISPDKSFAVAEFRSASDATVALALDGISMSAEDSSNGASNGSGGSGLSIQRPKDYIVPTATDFSGYQPGVVLNVVVDTPNKISICNIPPYLSDEQVTELLVSFGELRAFVLVKDRSTEESRGIAFCEYAEASSTEIAIQGLNGMDLGDKKLRVSKASTGAPQVTSVEMGVNAMAMLAGAVSPESSDAATSVIELLNMVTSDELVDNDDYDEICDDVRDECSKFGKVLKLKIPRPVSGGRQSAGIGRIFVKFDSKEAATKAVNALSGRKYADRAIAVTYFPEESFEVDAW